MKKRILFASDLDNTLLISHRNRQEGDICVEHNQGIEQSFMTRRVIEILRQLSKMVDFVPITTRSLRQYKRIQWPKGCEPKLAVVANGALLLRQGEVDESWSQQIRPAVDSCRDELQVQYARQYLSKEYIRCRIVDDSYLFLYCDEETDIRTCADVCRKQTWLQVEYQGRKIYFFPPGLDKGAALRRLREYLGSCYVYAAGDSRIDVPMLEVAEMAFAESGLQGAVGGNCQVQPGGTVFSEWMLEKVFDCLNL